MPNRILKESICTSETIDGLSIEAETFFYRLMVQCDDFGRMDARPSVLRARCYPLRLDKITDKQVSRWLNELSDADLLWVYEVEGRAYLQVTTWDKHQQKRAKHSKYPQPPERDITCNQLQADSSNSPREYENTRSENTRSDSGAGAPLPPEPPTPDPVKELAAVFEQASGIKLPQATTKKGSSTIGVTWWAPLREMFDLADGAAPELLTRVVRQMRADGLTIRGPISCRSNFISAHGADNSSPTTVYKEYS